MRESICESSKIESFERTKESLCVRFSECAAYNERDICDRQRDDSELWTSTEKNLVYQEFAEKFSKSSAYDSSTDFTRWWSRIICLEWESCWNDWSEKSWSDERRRKIRNFALHMWDESSI
jgi:hypothetical protein